MERFDDKLKRMAQEEDFPLPDWAEACMEEALENLPQRRKKGRVIFKYFGTALAACLALLIALPNLSAQAADSLSAVKYAKVYPIYNKDAKDMPGHEYEYVEGADDDLVVDA